MVSINPFNQEIIGNYELDDRFRIMSIIENSNEAFKEWKKTDLNIRRWFNLELARILETKKEIYAKLITNEMGKPIKESTAEIEKCIWLCKHYASNESFDLTPKVIKTEAKEVYLSYEPIGTVFAIMPWNFPFWQVLRFAIPSLTAGNTVILKHAPNVTGCSIALEDAFVSSGFPKNIFRSVVIPAERSEEIIGHPYIKGVTLTGSEKAGKAVGTLCGKYLKKCVLELGGSDPFIIFEDAELSLSCSVGLRSRMLNSGQVCIAAKRFIVQDSIVEKFILEQKESLNALVLGNPLMTATDLGPMARPDLVDQIEIQVNQSVEMGAKVIYGGKRSDTHPQIFEPTLLSDVRKGMPVYDDETFGPVMVVIPFKTKDEAVTIANDTRFGLGASIWTQNIELARELIPRIEAGAVFVNSIVKSDPRIPFGGIKNSGYGRELAFEGVTEFLNIKTNWIE
jgi:succinate-semialdehyde dehydrogenase / glutarate-semialdehyde dehydrogenase